MITRLPSMTLMTILLALALAGTVVPTPVAANSDYNEALRILERIDQSGKTPDANTLRLAEQAAGELNRALKSQEQSGGISASAEFRQHARRALELARQAEAAHGRGAVGGGRRYSQHARFWRGWHEQARGGRERGDGHHTGDYGCV